MLCALFIQIVSKLAFVILRNDPLDNIVVSSSALVSLFTVCYCVSWVHCQILPQITELSGITIAL